MIVILVCLTVLRYSIKSCFTPIPLKIGRLLNDQCGVISYDEYLFLLSALSAPPRQFELAFKLFDLDGNGVVDITEFGKVQLAVQNKTATGRKLHSIDSSTISTDHLARSQMLQRASFILGGEEFFVPCDNFILIVLRP